MARPWTTLHSLYLSWRNWETRCTLQQRCWLHFQEDFMRCGCDECSSCMISWSLAGENLDLQTKTLHDSSVADNRLVVVSSAHDCSNNGLMVFALCYSMATQSSDWPTLCFANAYLVCLVFLFIYLLTYLFIYCRLKAYNLEYIVITINSKTRRLFGNFRTADFHHIWPWHMNPCPIEDFLRDFQKFSVQGDLSPKNLKIEGSNRHFTQTSLQPICPWDTLQRDSLLFTPRCSPKDQGVSKVGQLFCTTYIFRTTGVKVYQFLHVCLFFCTIRLIPSSD